MADLEAMKGKQVELVGYASVANFIASDKEHSTSIYRRYKQLAARNMLYLQSELRILELRQEELDREDAGGKIDDLDMAMDLEVLAERALKPDDHKAKERVKLSKEISEKLKEYEETLLRNAAVLQLRQPTKQVYNAFQSEFNNNGKSQELRFPKLAGTSSDLYEEDHADDLITLCPSPPDEDRLTIWLRHHFPTLFMRRRQKAGQEGRSFAASLSEKRLQIFVAMINVVLAAAMLFGAIYNLYYVSSNKTKLGLISGYTIAFALCVGMLTNSRRSEIFGACAAYAAVLVVFVSGNLGNSNSSNG